MSHESARPDEVRSTTPARRIARTVTLPPPEPGFLGPGHSAVEVLRPEALGASDPFVLLMDDRIDFAPGRSIGGAHPMRASRP